MSAQVDHLLSPVRLDLSEQRCRIICLPSCRLNLIPALAGMAKNYARLAINLIAPAGLVATLFGVPVDANRREINEF